MARKRPIPDDRLEREQAYGGTRLLGPGALRSARDGGEARAGCEAINSLKNSDCNTPSLAADLPGREILAIVPTGQDRSIAPRCSPGKARQNHDIA